MNEVFDFMQKKCEISIPLRTQIRLYIKLNACLIVDKNALQVTIYD